MEWSPSAVHIAGENGQRIISGWTEQWLCRTCGGTATPEVVGPGGSLPQCSSCSAWMVWVVDMRTQAGEWRCQACRRDDVFISPVQPGVSSGGNNHTLDVAVYASQNAQRWPAEQLQEYLQSAVDGVAGRLHELADRARTQYISPATTRLSDVVSPWLWLGAESEAPATFCDAVAELVDGVPAGVAGWGIDGPSAIREIWRQTQQAFRARGIFRASDLLIWVHSERVNILQWMAGDTRYSRHPARPAPQFVGAHLEDYEQEFLLDRLVEARAHSIQLLSPVFLAAAQHLAHAMPPNHHDASDEPAGAAQDSHGGRARMECSTDSEASSSSTGPRQGTSTRNPGRIRGTHNTNASGRTRAAHPPASGDAGGGNSHVASWAPDAWVALDRVDLASALRQRVKCVQRLPAFLRGNLRNAYHNVLEEVALAYQAVSDQQLERAWQLLVLMWRMLLRRTATQGAAGREEFNARLHKFEMAIGLSFSAMLCRSVLTASHALLSLTSKNAPTSLKWATPWSKQELFPRLASA